MNDPNSIMGYVVYDKLTNFRGRATGIITYISGCVQVLISPPVKDDGTEREGRFFDIQRLVVDHSITPIKLENQMVVQTEARPVSGHGQLPIRRETP